MTYKVNDVALLTQPTTGRWLPREELGRTGEDRSILPGTRSFEMSWITLDATGTYQLHQAYLLQGSTGTSSMDLPTFGASPYAFQTFSGVLLAEPQVGEYFEHFYLNVILRVDRVSIL